ncbi:small subunit ribosomal protein S16 [bacterium A37T11]|nr:small subunit ribosomal protein S16 [bacterium A37T11]
MATKIRLQRFGKKGKPFYHVVVADSRAPRDGKFIERLGSYNPNTNPATIELDFDSALNWLIQGAQPTDTAKAILSYKGVLYKKHLLGGVTKGAFDEATADARFNEWLEKKGGLIESKKESLSKLQAESKQAAFEAEAKKKADIAAAIAAKNAPKVVEEPIAEEAVEESAAPAADEAEEK